MPVKKVETIELEVNEQGEAVPAQGGTSSGGMEPSTGGSGRTKRRARGGTREWDAKRIGKVGLFLLGLKKLNDHT